MPERTLQEKQEEKLQELRRHEEEKRTEERAQKLDLPYIDLALFPISADDLLIIPGEVARAGGIVAFRKDVKKLEVGVLDPKSELALQTIQKLHEEQGYEVEAFLISPSSFKKTVSNYEIYKRVPTPKSGTLPIDERYLTEFNALVKDITELKDRISERTTTEVLDTIVAGALKLEAGDIHIEPGEVVRLRYRIDGVLQDVAVFSAKTYGLLVSRIKLLSGLLLNVKDRAQDGRFTIQIQRAGQVAREIDVRVSVLPEKNAETIVMRLLGVGVTAFELSRLGIRETALARLQEEMRRPHGIILNTGPTGSGKTTTLYGGLMHLNNPKIKIITVEDPVEYRLPGIVQTQVGKSYSFAAALRAILRQNPNIIMIGEIRDQETMQIAFQAALTGHLVLSTIHANDAVSTVERLRDLGLDIKLIPDAVNAIIAQRLVRKLCTNCKEVYAPDLETRTRIEKALTLISPKANIEIPQTVRLARARGCQQCLGLKYRGRAPLFELLTMTPEVRRLIMERASVAELLKTAIDDGMLTLYQDGVLRAIEGLTDLEEVERVVGVPAWLDELYERSAAASLTRGIVIKKEVRDEIQRALSKKQGLTTLLANSKQEVLLRRIVAAALETHATDVHLEPTEAELLVRYRIDGVLQDVAKVPKLFHLPLVGEIKILSGLKVGVHAEVQEGRFGIQLEQQRLDARVSVIAGGYGETTVVRILGGGEEVVGAELEELGVRKETLPELEIAIKKPTGIIFNTGPTGSGKTTTLYAVLKKLNQRGVKIMTVEDPIEYRIPGVLQTQVNLEEGYTFAKALRSFLRQNPNIIMIGEVRDEETAKTAVQAALTGHLVLSTLHTNDAASSVQRLRNLGVSAGDIASAANAFLAQRLVRKLCPRCKKPYAPEEATKRFIRAELSSGAPLAAKLLPKAIRLWKAAGCPNCAQLGYRGQTGLFELLTKNETVEGLILKDASPTEIKKAAQQKGMLTLRQDGVGKALEGMTTLEEVERVCGKLGEKEL